MLHLSTSKFSFSFKGLTTVLISKFIILQNQNLFDRELRQPKLHQGHNPLIQSLQNKQVFLNFDLED